MRVISIANNNINIQKKQKSPTFQARIPKPLVKQMQGKTEPLKELVVKSAVGIFSVPAASVAAYFLNDSDKDANSLIVGSSEAKLINFYETDSLKDLTSEELYNLLKKQNEKGETILHRRGFDLDTANMLRNKLDEDKFVEILSIKDNDDIPVADFCDTDIAKVVTSPDFKLLSLENTLKLFKNIGIESNVIKFLESRLEKHELIEEHLSSVIDADTLEQLENVKTDDPINVFTRHAKFKNLSIATVAELFEKDGDYYKIDGKYFPLACDDEISDLMRSAMDSSRDGNPALDELFNAINEMESSLDKFEFLDLALSENLSEIKPEYLLNIYDKFGKDIFKNLVLNVKDENGRGLFHHLARDVAFSDFKSVYSLFKNSVNDETFREVMLSKDKKGAFPISYDKDFAKDVLGFYGNKNDFSTLDILLKSIDSHGDTLLSQNLDFDLLQTALGIYQGRNEDLADILSNKDGFGNTVLSYYDEDEKVAFVESKILELATNSDLSIDKSIALLESNDMESQIVDYLKLQQQAANTSKS